MAVFLARDPRRLERPRWFSPSRGLRGIIPAWGCAAAASFITFGALWIFRVLAVAELLNERSLRHSRRQR